MKNSNLKTKVNDTKGITLVALVISIIVLLILATVSINLVINNGILDKAKTAVDKYSEGEIEEQIKLAYLEWQTAQLTGTTENASDFIKKRLNSSIGNIEDVSLDDNALTVTISKDGEDKTYYYNVKKGIVRQIELAKNSSNKNDSYVGYYADIDEDGVVDGVIFADLLTKSVRDNQQWYNSYGNYTLPDNVTVDNVNTYYLTGKKHTWAGIENPVISPKTTNKEKRFYIMQLSDFKVLANTETNNTSSDYTSFYWYYSAKGNMSPLITDVGFGTGRENTRKMIEKWNAAGEENPTITAYTDSIQNNEDIWKHIQTKYNQGWFIPSIAEWAAFLNEIGGDNPITMSNYNSKYGLNDLTWSSSQVDVNKAWATQRNWGFVHKETTSKYYVRLVTTF